MSYTKKNIIIDIPFNEMDPKIWDILYEGIGSYKGLNYIFKYFDRKRYKKDIRIYMRSLQSEYLCKECEGTRINKISLSHKLESKTYKDILNCSIEEGFIFLKKINGTNKNLDFAQLIQELLELYSTAIKLGLGNISLSRKAKTLTTGEYQRSLLCKYFSFKGSESLFVLDEPGIGLDDNEQDNLSHLLAKAKRSGQYYNIG